MRDGKVVAITGASSGMGEAIARTLAARGDRVVLGARGEAALARVGGEIRAAGGEASWRPTDVARHDEVSALIAHAVATYGRIDVFVANAGAMPIGPMDALAVDD